MKTVIAKLLTLVMVLMAVLTMAACGSKSEEQPKEEAAVEEKAEEPAEEEAVEEEVVEEAPVEETDGDYTGTYLGQLDFSDMMKEQFTQSLGVEIDDPLYMDVTLNLNEDETFNLKIDAEKFKADVIAVMKNHIDDIIAAMMEQNGLSMDDLDELAKGRTVIVVAHRLSTMRNVSQVAVVTPDGIAERGTKEELLARHGIFSRLYHYQFDPADGHGNNI